MYYTTIDCTSNNERNIWIDNLKLIACLIVFLGHYCSAFGFAVTDCVFLLNPVLKAGYIFIFGNWWVYVFCIISGFFAAKKTINSFAELLFAIIKRYIRFLIPVLFGNLFVLFIFITFGFENIELGNLYNSTFLTEAYNNPLTLQRAFISAILLSHEFIGPLWVLRDIFLGTCCIYILNFFYKKSSKIFSLICILLCLLCYYLYRHAPCLHVYLYYTILTCAGGFFLRIVWGAGRRESDSSILTFIFTVIAVLPLCFLWYLQNGEFRYVRLFRYVRTFIAISFTALIPFSYLRSILSKSISLNKLSFTIYLLHCPLIFSLSVKLFFILSNGFSLPVIFFINLIITTALLFLISVIYYLLIEKNVDNFIYQLTYLLGNEKRSKK